MAVTDGESITFDMLMIVAIALSDLTGKGIELHLPARVVTAGKNSRNNGKALVIMADFFDNCLGSITDHAIETDGINYAVSTTLGKINDFCDVDQQKLMLNIAHIRLCQPEYFMIARLLHSQHSSADSPAKFPGTKHGSECNSAADQNIPQVKSRQTMKKARCDTTIKQVYL